MNTNLSVVRVVGLAALGGWVVCQQHPGQIEDEARFVCKCVTTLSILVM